MPSVTRPRVCWFFKLMAPLGFITTGEHLQQLTGRSSLREAAAPGVLPVTAAPMLPITQSENLGTFSFYEQLLQFGRAQSFGTATGIAYERYAIVGGSRVIRKKHSANESEQN